MTTAPSSASNSRASLLSGLRTGGVRSSSASIPHTAAPGGTFNVPRLVPQPLAVSGNFPNEEQDYLPEMSSQFANNHYAGSRIPMTAAVDGANNRFSQQQMNPNVAPFSPAFTPQATPQQQAQALQMQMMQLELMRIQAQQIQAQQYQAEMIVQAQRQQNLIQQQAQNNRRASLGFNPPATAGPLSTGFDIRTATLNAQMRRANERAQLGVGADENVPMTAALGGKFGSRTSSVNVPTSSGRFDESGEGAGTMPPTPNTTTVISGGTSLGNLASNNINGGATTSQSKSDTATSWRRGGKGNSVLANRSVTSPAVKVTPPPPESLSTSSSGTVAAAKVRPQPLRFNVLAQQPLPTVTIDTSEVNDNDDSSSTSSSKSGGGSNSSPTTPHSSSSNEMPLSPREEASKKLYEGLGIGRPASTVSNSKAVVSITVVDEAVPQQQSVVDSLPNLASHRLVSQPLRQPRGPPSGADELGPKNFATRIRRKAIGGLGMLLDARERRELVEVC